MDIAEHLRVWLQEKAPRLRCPVCESQSFSVDSTVAMTNSINPDGGRIDYMSGFPLIAVGCSNCGHVLFFNAKTVGVM